jgi:anaerobic selenocysteine-containing dehydrogenase
VPQTYAPFAKGEFPTPSGRCEFYSEQVAKLAQDPLPAYLAPYEAADVRSERSRHPLAIISPPARNFLNSTFVNVVSLRATEGEPTVEIHPDDARRRNIDTDDRVRIFNDRGSIEVRARVTDRARPGCVVALSIWWKKLARDGKNANELTSQALTDIGRGPTFYDCLVEVEPA